MNVRNNCFELRCKWCKCWSVSFRHIALDYRFSLSLLGLHCSVWYNCRWNHSIRIFLFSGCNNTIYKLLILNPLGRLSLINYAHDLSILFIEWAIIFVFQIDFLCFLRELTNLVSCYIFNSMELRLCLTELFDDNEILHQTEFFEITLCVLFDWIQLGNDLCDMDIRGFQHLNSYLQ